ncbi:unnamed protein product [Cyprideis torosa]|uniref:Uncharacterized protein n=1 Tax=Cyprideis torosa TaxID=163714 RepID=A0A7R8WA84_9CRUS|nr:unnamed protein product [Cyprideis torosa]CAG0885625.1 unnamed protein product [Cyprideis torosa]
MARYSSTTFQETILGTVSSFPKRRLLSGNSRLSQAITDPTPPSPPAKKQGGVSLSPLLDILKSFFGGSDSEEEDDVQIQPFLKKQGGVSLSPLLDILKSFFGGSDSEEEDDVQTLKNRLQPPAKRPPPVKASALPRRPLITLPAAPYRGVPDSPKYTYDAPPVDQDLKQDEEEVFRLIPFLATDALESRQDPDQNQISTSHVNTIGTDLPESTTPKSLDYCDVRGSKYPIGSLLPSRNLCVVCSCAPGGHAQCNKLMCPQPPAGCTPVPIKNQCCPKFVCGEDAEPRTPNRRKTVDDPYLLRPPRPANYPIPEENILKKLNSIPSPPLLRPNGIHHPSRRNNLPVSGIPQNRRDPFLNHLNLGACNIYGKMYRVGRVISELSGPCVESRVLFICSGVV